MNAGRSIKLCLACLSLAALAACAQERERAAQQDAVQYTLHQHDSTLCANAGMPPGSSAFNDCIAKLENPQPAGH